MNRSELEQYIAEIGSADEEALAAARERQAALIKPPGSLGELEEISIRLAGVTGKVRQHFRKPLVIILSADNGVYEEGVSSAPQTVTIQQTINFIRRMTGVGALTKEFGNELLVLDMGINGDVPAAILSKDMEDYQTKVIDRKIAYGTKNFAKEPAMSEEQVLQAIAAGIEAVEFAKAKGHDILGVGEMGICNTSTSAAVLGALANLSAEQVCGRGGGLEDAPFLHKKDIVADAIAEARTNRLDPVGVLALCGGFDIAAMTGVFLAAAHEHIPVVIDGYISVTAAVAAAKLCPEAADYMFPSHQSFEIGYKKAVTELGLHPYLDLGMRLGEGSGCVIGFEVIRAACAVMDGMATFAEGGINDDYLEEIRKGDCF